ncbi:MAG: monofunctional biosynthetic peptidoglycan transglycosylase [Bacteroidales bacterium]|jgi:monofunctional biosynthetic peptidoglycan transglycosylase|nr:monofunctional biosynthetic peptidoglycan transglycosylase [Bacteroidales bacterium]
MASHKKKAKIVPSFKTWLRWAGIILLVLVLYSVTTVAIYRWLNPPFTLLMLSRSIEGVKSVDRKWLPFDQIPQSMIDAVVASEDNNFAVHYGFEFSQMKAAFRENKKGKRIRGASTITQQMCKNVFLWEKRSYFRKALEAWFTVWVELIWSKERIMEVYLNVIEMGNGIYGIEAASQSYYRHPAARLTREEAAMITAALPSPRKRNPARPTAYLIRRQAQILSLMDKIGKVKLSHTNHSVSPDLRNMKGLLEVPNNIIPK